MYANWLLGFPTHPGTETNVTPEREAPTIPKATKYQGDFLSPTKKVSLLAPLLVKYMMPISKMKYPTNIEKTKIGVISNKVNENIKPFSFSKI